MRPTLCVALCCLLLCIVAIESLSNCPHCDVSIPPQEGSGQVNGRTRINVYIHSSWNINENGQSISGTNSNIWNAVVGYHDQNVNLNGATEMWNNATSGANHINYFLEPNQSTFSNTDVVIKRGEPGGGCADATYNPSSGNWVITLADGLKNLPHEWIAAIIAHELGHVLGLINHTDTQCTTSIMSGHVENCEPLIKAISAGDVDAVRQHFANRMQCGAQSEPTVYPIPESSPIPICPDNDQDAVCNDDDCNDGNANAAFDLDGDGFCEDVDCNDTNSQVYPGAPLDPETTGNEDRNCNGQDDYHEQGLGPCGWLAEQMCRAAGKNWEPGRCTCEFFSDPSPIVIDVFGNGFNLTNFDNGVLFDLNNDGVAEQLSWTKISSDDAWLVLDRNGNGFIENGSELFGNFTPQPNPPVGEERNGFLALAEFDKPVNGGNGDRVIDRKDAVFSSLRLWQDLNHNGISELMELSALNVWGLKKIDLDYQMSKRIDKHGNKFRYRARVMDDQEAQLGRWAWDVFLLHAP